MPTKNLTKVQRTWLTLGIMFSIFALLLSHDRQIINRKQSTDSLYPNIQSGMIFNLRSAYQLDVPLINQMDEPAIFNGCEVTSLAMLMAYYNLDITKNELAEKIKKVPLDDENGLSGDPNEGFVGDIDGNLVGYSVYHGPIKRLATELVPNTIEVIDLTMEPFELLLTEINQGNPVWVITTVSFEPTNDLEIWETINGPIEISWNVHSVVVTGFDEDFIYINDPYGEKDLQVDRVNFIAAWEQMGQQGIVFHQTNDSPT